MGDYPFRCTFEENCLDGRTHAWFDEKAAAEIRTKYAHPLWRDVSAMAKKVGGHGGMDFIMDLRWAYCLKLGLPLDTDVYDLASWCAVNELSERSARNRSAALDFPDFTRGAWKMMKPFEICDMDISKFGEIKVHRDEDALKANKSEGII